MMNVCWNRPSRFSQIQSDVSAGAWCDSSLGLLGPLGLQQVRGRWGWPDGGSLIFGCFLTWGTSSYHPKTVLYDVSWKSHENSLSPAGKGHINSLTCMTSCDRRKRPKRNRNKRTNREQQCLGPYGFNPCRWSLMNGMHLFAPWTQLIWWCGVHTQGSAHWGCHQSWIYTATLRCGHRTQCSRARPTGCCAWWLPGRYWSSKAQAPLERGWYLGKAVQVVAAQEIKWSPDHPCHPFAKDSRLIAVQAWFCRGTAMTVYGAYGISGARWERAKKTYEHDRTIRGQMPPILIELKQLQMSWTKLLRFTGWFDFPLPAPNILQPCFLNGFWGPGKF